MLLTKSSCQVNPYKGGKIKSTSLVRGTTKLLAKGVPMERGKEVVINEINLSWFCLQGGCDFLPPT
jgi:hypothetical protein